MAKKQDAQAIIVGGGPAGLTAAITLAAGGAETVLVGLRPAKPDHRTTALLAGSVTALTTLGVWNACAPHAAPLRTMRIVDDTGRLWRAPEVKFEAHEIGLDEFGWNIENRHLIAALDARAHTLPNLRIIDSQVSAVETGADEVIVHLSGESLQAPLVIGADGRRSLCRDAAGIEVTTREYPQVALAVSFAHTRPHNNTSTEFHTASGPFTVVPLPGLRSSLVWVLDPTRADEIAALDDDALSIEIERGTHSILGKVKVEPGRGLFPLTMTTAERFASNRIALVGEAAHVMPPIGAQGLNLGLRDAATIGELALNSLRANDDPGSDLVMHDYDRLRRADIGTRTLAVDMLNRTLLSDFLPAQSVRGLGLYLVDRIGPLRRAVMREGIAPSSAQPRLMRGETV